MTDIGEKVKDYIANSFFSSKEDTLDENTKLLSSGVVDSISALQLVEFLEKEFSFEFEAHEVDQDNLDSIAIIVEFVQRKIAS